MGKNRENDAIQHFFVDNFDFAKIIEFFVGKKIFKMSQFFVPDFDSPETLLNLNGNKL